jgi:hypothetical protein
LRNGDDSWVHLEEFVASDLHNGTVADDEHTLVDVEEDTCEEAPCCCLVEAYTCTDCKIVVAFEAGVVGEITSEEAVRFLEDKLEPAIFFVNFFVIYLCLRHLTSFLSRVIVILLIHSFEDDFTTLVRLILVAKQCHLMLNTGRGFRGIR